MLEFILSSIVSPSGSVSVFPRSTTLSIGSKVTLVCTANGGPNNIFSWARSGTPVATTSVLNVTIASATDGGLFLCTVSNAAGSDSASTLFSGTC